MEGPENPLEQPLDLPWATSGVMEHYPQHQQPPLLNPGPAQYAPAPEPYNQYGYSNGLISPQSAGQPGMPGPGYGIQQGFDMTGQVAPPGMKPRVAATLWEDEGSLCFQVEAKGVCVARREDNHMINGTKLLNVAGMTRARRDGILKSEKMRHVVKIGPMHLKGVWIPFERALDFANKEKITELLYPLFVHNIGALLYHPTNQTRTNAVIAAAGRRKQEQNQMRNMQPPSGLPSLHLHHYYSMNNSISRWTEISPVEGELTRSILQSDTSISGHNDSRQASSYARISRFRMPYGPRPSRRDGYGKHLTSHQGPWQVSRGPGFLNNNYHCIRQPPPRYLGAQSVLCFGSASNPRFCILAPTSEAVVHHFRAWFAASKDQSGTDYLSLRVSPAIRSYPSVPDLPHVEAQIEQLVSHEYRHDDQEELVLQILERFDQILSFCENRGVFCERQSRTNTSLTLQFRFGDLFVTFPNQSETFWGDNSVDTKVQCPWLNQSEQSGRNNQMEEEAEMSGHAAEATTPFIKTTPNSHSDSDSSNFEDETDWEEDNDITNAELTSRLSLSNALTWMARRLEELLLGPLLADHQQKLVNRLMGEFWEFIAMNTTMHTQTNEISSTSNTSPPTGRTAATTSKGKLKGRSRDDIDDENPENEDTRGFKRPKLTNSSSSSMAVSMLFACPYRKHDPRKYNIHDWSTCALTPHRSVARVKGHLYRYHRIHLCPRCKALFASEGELEEHSLAPVGCDLRISIPIEGITSKMKEQLQCRKKAHPGQTEAERWQQIYHILFSDEPAPSPYFEPVKDHEESQLQSSDTRELSRYDEYLRRELPRYFRGVLETAVHGEFQSIEARLRGELLSLLDEARNHALSYYNAPLSPRSTIMHPRPSLSQPHVEVSGSPYPTLETQAIEIIENFHHKRLPSPHPEFSLDFSSHLANFSQENEGVTDIQYPSDSHSHTSRPESSEDLTLDRASSNTTDTSTFQNILSTTDPTPLHDLELSGDLDFLDDLGPNYQKSMDLDSFPSMMPWDTSTFYAYDVQ